MNGMISIISIVLGILSLILFIKIWGLCSKVTEIKELLEKSNQTQIKRYHYIYDTSIEALRAEEAIIKELVYCKKYDEAKIVLDRLQFHFAKTKESYGKFGYSAEAQMKTESEILEQILESAKQWA